MSESIIYVADDLTGEYHDASMCTFDGREYYVASLSCSKKNGRGTSILDTFGASDPKEAEAWLLKEMRFRTGKEPERI